MRFGSFWALVSVSFAPALAFAQDDLSSGGLAPPEAVESDTSGAPPSTTEAELEQADKRDAGRGLEFFWFNAEAGAQYLGLQTFKANDLVDASVVSTTQVGPTFGVGAGVRLIVFTLGARFRLGAFEEWQLWTLDGEFGVRIPIGSLEPYFSLAAGYASLGSFQSGALSDAGVTGRGFNARAAFGIDYYVGDTFSIGGNLSGDILYLTRPGVGLPDLEGSDLRREIYEQDGSSVGSSGTLTVVAGLHF